MNKKDSFIIYFGIFILIIVTILFCFIDREDPDDNFTYQDLPKFINRKSKSNNYKKESYPKPIKTKREYKEMLEMDDNIFSNSNKSEKRNIDHPVLEYQKDSSRMSIPANWGDSIRLYSNLGDSSDYEKNIKHPVLEYQRNYSSGLNPAIWGDPIRPLNIGASPSPSNFRESGNGNFNSYAYRNGEGPIPGDLMGVPVKRENMKSTNEYHGAPFYNNHYNQLGNNNNNNNHYNQLGNNNTPFDYKNNPIHSYDYFKPYQSNQNSIQSEINYADTPFYNKNNNNSIPFISSVDSFAPFPEVNSNWEKSGMIQTIDQSDNEIMNIYRKAIAPLRDLFEYSVQDKNGFVVPLKETYLEDGDIINSVPGREGLGKWRYNDYVRYKYVYQ
jgi:hypothetical protein